jgi:hypothetical protein
MFTAWEVFWICVSACAVATFIGAGLGYYTRCKEEERD